MKIKYLTTKQVIEINRQSVLKCLPEGAFYLPIKDIGGLESVIELIKNDDYYPDIYSKADHLMYGIIMNHPFSDGNKRTALRAWHLFVTKNQPYVQVIFSDIILVAGYIMLRNAIAYMGMVQATDRVKKAIDTKSLMEQTIKDRTILNVINRDLHDR
jgi:prophage maintenance system killer protein